MLKPDGLQNGSEQHEKFRSSKTGGVRVQYDYRHTDGSLFTCVKKTLKECRQKRDEWIQKIDTKA